MQSGYIPHESYLLLQCLEVGLYVVILYQIVSFFSFFLNMLITVNS
jgi:hypothetical protein